MSYTPTEWESTDVVTATRMNALEQAVGDMNMSYTPNTWSDGDILSAEKMNALEQAVASGGGGSSDFSTARVTVNPDDGYVELNGFVPVILDDEGEFITCVDSLENGYNVVLYNGSLVLVTTTEPTYTVSGNATLETIEPIMPMEPTRYKLTITGDCTITIS